MPNLYVRARASYFSYLCWAHNDMILLSEYIVFVQFPTLYSIKLVMLCYSVIMPRRNSVFSPFQRLYYDKGYCSVDGDCLRDQGVRFSNSNPEVAGLNSGVRK